MSENIPFQIEQLINGMFNSKDNIHVRGNFRTRLASIRDALDKAIKKYDHELFIHNTQDRTSKKKKA